MTALIVATRQQLLSVSPYLVTNSGMACEVCKDDGRVLHRLAGYRPVAEECDDCKACEGTCGRRVVLSDGEDFCAACMAAGENGEVEEYSTVTKAWRLRGYWKDMAFLRKLTRQKRDRHDWASYSVLCTRLHLITRESFLAATASNRRGASQKR